MHLNQYVPSSHVPNIYSSIYTLNWYKYSMRTHQYIHLYQYVPSSHVPSIYSSIYTLELACTK